MKRVVIIGAGPAGLTAAINAVSEDTSVTVLESNGEVGKKLLLTGNGRCNYFNEVFNEDKFYSNNNEFLKLIINEDNIDSVYKFFNNLGIETKVKNGYMYPFSNKASTMRNTLLDECLLRGVDIRYNYTVERIEFVKDHYVIDKTIECDYVVVATGGLSIPKTGSTGFAKSVADAFDLGYVPNTPSLVKLTTDSDLNIVSGVRCDAEVSLFVDNKKLKSEVGEIQFNKDSISGICIFNISRNAVIGLSRNRKVNVFVNFLPKVKYEDMVYFLDNKARNLKNITVSAFLSRIFNEKLVSYILKVSSIKDGKLYDKLSDEEKINIAKNISKMKFNIVGSGDYSSAEVTTGGVSLLELNLNSFECIRQKNLFFIGECVDIDGDCGGYNLGFAWISGILAGSYIRGQND
ncbi:MAG: aminoacetone oxidase family FAD-binding enzyme [Bacilli bacterium]|nr:aminoacetone oxidase family FAD-binding enzyme [Bacilli bacterium]